MNCTTCTRKVAEGQYVKRTVIQDDELKRIVLCLDCHKTDVAGKYIADRLAEECHRRERGLPAAFHINDYLKALTNVAEIGTARDYLEPRCSESPLIATCHELLAERIIQLC